MFNRLTFCLMTTLIVVPCANGRATEPSKSSPSSHASVLSRDLNSANSTANNSTVGCETCGGEDLQHSQMSCGRSAGAACGSGCGGHHGKGHGHGCNNCNGYHQGHFSTRCNMIPHVAYINPLNSYYYFRPYQFFHVRYQQEEVTSYGADPRQPYANLMFPAIYPELEAAWAEEAGNSNSPFEDEVPAGDAPAIPDEQPAESPVPESNTSAPIQRDSQTSPEHQFEKPANNTASVPGNYQGVFRTRR